MKEMGSLKPERGLELFLEEVRARMGIEKELGEPVEVEKGAIRRYVEAIMESNPLYTDEGHARRHGFSSIVAPPLFLCGVPPGGLIPPHPEELLALHGADEWELLIPVQAGDRITRTGKVIHIAGRKGKRGNMFLVKMELIFTNQRGEVVARYWPTVIFLQRKEEG